MTKKNVPQELLPWYSNNCLNADEGRSVENWLRENPQAKTELASLGQLCAAIEGQVQEKPADAVRQGVMARVRATAGCRPQIAERGWRVGLQWAVGTVMTLAVLVLLWGIIQPGIVLQWTLQGGEVATFQVYQARQGGDTIVPVRQSLDTYQYPTAITLQSLNAATANNIRIPMTLATFALVYMGTLIRFRHQLNKQIQSY